MENRIYLDNAATSPLDPEVLDAMIPVMRDFYGNPSSTHAHGRKAKGMMEEARGTVAKLLGCSPAEIFFTSGGTEADNLALRCAVKDLGVKTSSARPSNTMRFCIRQKNWLIKEWLSCTYCPSYPMVT